MSRMWEPREEYQGRPDPGRIPVDKVKDMTDENLEEWLSIAMEDLELAKEELKEAEETYNIMYGKIRRLRKEHTMLSMAVETLQKELEERDLG